MAAVKYLSAILAFIQFFLVEFNFKSFNTDVDYGGEPKPQVEVSRWLTVIENGASDYVIVLGEQASPSETTAANELQSALEQAGSVKLPIVSDAAAPVPHEIIVGKTSREDGGGYAIDRAALGDEGFRLLTAGEKIVIAGGQARGTLYGVYTFLEEQLGFRWFTDTLTVVPDLHNMRVNADLDDTQKPYFDFRCVGWSGSVAWRVKHKYNYVNQAQFGYGQYYAAFCHTMPKLVPDTLFETHPEYFAYREDTGGRTTAHVCLSSPGALAVAIENARAVINAAKAAGTPVTLMGVGQKDNMEECQCAECTAFNLEHGSPSATLVAFTNAVAGALAEEFPEVKFVFLAYQQTRTPPVGITCSANVIPFLCSIECCFCHPLGQCGAEDNKDESFLYRFSDHESRFAADLEGWDAIAGEIHYYDYTVNFLNTQQFYANLATFSPNFQYLLDHGVTGLYESGGTYYGKSGEFGELRAYLILKLMWDPYCDVEYHMDEFLKAYYGEEAAKYIKEYIDYATAKITATDHIFCFDWHYQIGYFTMKEINRFDTLFDKAEASAEDAVKLERIERSRLQLRYYKANLLMEEFSFFNLSRAKANEELYDDFVRLGIQSVTAFSPELKPKAEIDFYLSRPIDWR